MLTNEFMPLWRGMSVGKDRRHVLSDVRVVLNVAAFFQAPFVERFQVQKGCKAARSLHGYLRTANLQFRGGIFIFFTSLEFLSRGQVFINDYTNFAPTNLPSKLRRARPHHGLFDIEQDYSTNCQESVCEAARIHVIRFQG